MAGETGIKPDIVTYGKIIGGGLPVGAIAGSKEYMEYLAPIGPVYQAGTLSANPLAMSAGLATLKLLTPQVYQQLDKTAHDWTNAFEKCFQKHGFSQYQMIRYKSLFWQCPSKENITTIEQIPGDLNAHFHKLFPFLLEKGVYLSPNAYEIGFISMAHDQSVLEEFIHKLC